MDEFLTNISDWIKPSFDNCYPIYVLVQKWTFSFWISRFCVSYVSCRIICFNSTTSMQCKEYGMARLDSHIYLRYFEFCELKARFYDITHKNFLAYIGKIFMFILFQNNKFGQLELKIVKRFCIFNNFKKAKQIICSAISYGLIERIL